MRKFAMLLLLAPIAGFGQSLVTIVPENCVWRADDGTGGESGVPLHWAAPDLEESGWKPASTWTLNPDAPRIWIRCHVNLSSLHATAHPALQLSLGAAYELFVDGIPAGSFGNMQTGNFTGDFVRTFPVPAPIPAQGASTIALRILFRNTYAGQFGSLPGAPRTEWLAGDQEQLQYRRNSLAFVNGSQTLPTTIAFFIVTIAGVMMLGLYLSDRSRPAFLYFAIVCVALGMRRILEQLVASLYPISLVEDRLLDACIVAALTCYVPLVYALARKSVPWLFRAIVALSMILPVVEAAGAIVPAAMSLRMAPLIHANNVFANVLFGVAFLSPFPAFRPWSQIAGSTRAVAAALMVWGVSNEAFIVILLSRSFPQRSVALIANTWSPAVQETRATLMIAAIVVLLVLMFRDQRNTAEQRAQLAGEMDAAREVQQQLVPASIPRVAGFDIAAAYLPAAEVGGDFYQVLPLADRATLIVMGDVSGKGLKAAMTGALAIGALRTLAAEGLSPDALLTRLNRQIVDAQNGGFITCLCLRVAANGTITAANAGHIPPYLAGKEVPLENGLPLGLAAEAAYAESAFQLAPNQQLTLLTDGVVEARDKAGELFGFDRTASSSNQSADQIAKTAQLFGQDDDITVLTLQRTAPA